MGANLIIFVVKLHLRELYRRCDGVNNVFSGLTIAGETWTAKDLLINEDEIQAFLLAAIQNREDIWLRFHTFIDDWRCVRGLDNELAL